MSATVIPLRAKLTQSIDMIDLGAAIRDAGTELTGMGTGIMQLSESPSDELLTQVANAASRMMRNVMAIRVRHAVELPADCERSE